MPDISPVRQDSNNENIQWGWMAGLAVGLVATAGLCALWPVGSGLTRALAYVAEAMLIGSGTIVGGMVGIVIQDSREMRRDAKILREPLTLRLNESCDNSPHVRPAYGCVVELRPKLQIHQSSVDDDSGFSPVRIGPVKVASFSEARVASADAVQPVRAPNYAALIGDRMPVLNQNSGPLTE